MATHYTYKGRPIDMGTMLMVNEHSVALGNANMNARGDILGKGGKVVTSKESIELEYQQNQPVVETDEDLAVDLFAFSPMADSVPAPVMETFDPSLLEDLDADEVAKPVKPKRRKAPTKGDE